MELPYHTYIFLQMYSWSRHCSWLEKIHVACGSKFVAMHAISGKIDFKTSNLLELSSDRHWLQHKCLLSLFSENYKLFWKIKIIHRLLLEALQFILRGNKCEHFVVNETAWLDTTFDIHQASKSFSLLLLIKSHDWKLRVAPPCFSILLSSSSHLQKQFPSAKANVFSSKHISSHFFVISIVLAYPHHLL